MNNKYCEMILDNIEKEYQEFKEEMLSQSNEYIFQWAKTVYFFNEIYWYFMYSALLKSFSEKQLERLSEEKTLLEEIYGFYNAIEADWIFSKKELIRIINCIYDFSKENEKRDMQMTAEALEKKCKEGDIFIGLNPESFTYLKPCSVKKIFSEENKGSLVYYVVLEYVDQTFPLTIETITMRMDYLNKYYKKIILE